MDDLKTKLALILFGTTLGAALFGAAYFIAAPYLPELLTPAGAKFDSLDDLRRSMLQRDEHDLKPDGNVSLRTIVQPNPSDTIIYELIPNMRAQFQNQIVQMNSLGMRGPETTVEKPAGTYRIAVLGDSYTFGWGVKQDEMFARVMEKELTRVKPDKKIEVLNFGVPGYATFQEVGQFLEKGAKFQPDMVIVYFISNDFGLPFFIRDLKTNTTLVPATDFHLTKLTDNNSPVAKRKSAMFSALDANRPLIKLGEYCAEHDIKLFLVPHPDASTKKTEFRLWYQNNTDSAKLVPELNIFDDYQAAVARHEVSEESLRIVHDNHPGPGAHRLIGEILAKRLAPMIK